MMEKLVMGDLQMMPAPEELMPGDMGGLISAVKSYDNSAGAIGYTPYYYAKNMKMADGLKILKVDGVMPDTDTIGKGEYPFRTSYFVVLPKNTPDDDPARILFNWILSPDGQKLAEMEGYVPASSDPAGKDDVKVSVDWTSYQPAEAADPVFTRLKDEEITDFVPSSEYGRIFPFAGSIKKSQWESAGLKEGLFDIHGRIVCDPVFDRIYNLTEDLYVVEKFVPNPKFPEHPTIQMGVISADGTKYTGLKYSNTHRRPDGGISLVENTPDGINVYPFDLKTCAVGTPAFYKINRSAKHYEDSLFINHIVHDRYVVYANEEGDMCWLIYDGKTGKELDFQNGLYMTDCVGNMLEGYDENAFDGKMTLCDFTGKELAFDVPYENFSELDPNTIFMTRANNKGWDLADADGNIRASLDNADQKILEVDPMDGCFFVRKQKSLEIYDMNFKPVSAVEVDDTEGFYYVYRMEENYSTSISADYDADTYYSRDDGEKTMIVDLDTGAVAEIEGRYNVTVIPGYLLLTMNVGDSEEYVWKLLDAKKMTIVHEGQGYVDVREDWKDGRLYLAIGKGWETDKLSLVDVITGETVAEDIPNPRGDSLRPDTVYDGNMLISTYHKIGYESYPSSTALIGLDGKVLFLYNTVNLPED